MTDPRLLTEAEVKHKLNNIGPNVPFIVIFLKNDGTQKAIKGATMEPATGTPKNPQVVPVRDPDSERGWGSFYTNRVIYLEVN